MIKSGTGSREPEKNRTPAQWCWDCQWVSPGLCCHLEPWRALQSELPGKGWAVWEQRDGEMWLWDPEPRGHLSSHHRNASLGQPFWLWLCLSLLQERLESHDAVPRKPWSHLFPLDCLGPGNSSQPIVSNNECLWAHSGSLFGSFSLPSLVLVLKFLTWLLFAASAWADTVTLN